MFILQFRYYPYSINFFYMTMTIFYFFTVLGSILLWIENYKLILNNISIFNLIFKRHIIVITITIFFIFILALYDIIFIASHDNKLLFHLLTYIFISILFYFINVCINISVKNNKQKNDYTNILIISILNILLGYIYLCIFLYNLNIHSIYLLLPLLYTIIPIISFLFFSFIFKLVPKNWLEPKFVEFINKNIHTESIAINLYNFNWFLSKIILFLFMALLTYFISMCTKNIIILNVIIIIVFAFILSFFSCKSLNIKLKDPSFKFIFIYFLFSLLLCRLLIGVFIYNNFNTSHINNFKYNYFNSSILLKNLNKVANYYIIYTNIVLDFKSVNIFNKLIYLNLNKNNIITYDMSNNNTSNTFSLLNKFVHIILKEPVYKNNELNYKYISHDAYKPIIHKILGNKINLPKWAYTIIPKADFSKYLFIKPTLYYNLTVNCFLEHKTYTVKFNILLDNFGKIKYINYIISELNKYKVSDYYPIKGKSFLCVPHNTKTILNFSQNKILLNTIKFETFVINLNDSISYYYLGKRKIGFIGAPVLGIDNVEVAFSQILETSRRLIIEIYPRMQVYLSFTRTTIWFDLFLVTSMWSLEHKYFACLTYIHKNHSDLYISMYDMHLPYYYIDKSSHLEFHRHLDLRDQWLNRDNNISIDFKRYEKIMDNISIIMSSQSKLYDLYTNYYPLVNSDLKLRDITLNRQNQTFINASLVSENEFRDSLINWLNLNEEIRPMSKALGLDLIKSLYEEQDIILTFFEPKNIMGVSNEELDSLVQKVRTIAR